MKKGKDRKSYNFRCAEELADWIKEQADKNVRTFNGEIVFRLEESRRQQLLAEGGSSNAGSSSGNNSEHEEQAGKG